MMRQHTGTNRKTQGAGSIRAIPASARARGIVCIGAPGVGKSRLFGRRLVWDAYLLEQPQVVFDPIGATIDNFLDTVIRHLPYLTKDAGETDTKRIVYVDMSGRDGYILPFPLYYRLGTERSLWEIAERYLQVIKKNDPSLVTRPIMGWPPLHKVGVYAGMVLTALGYQITEAESLLLHPEQWEARFQQAEARYPTVTRAVSYFRDEYLHLRKSERERVTNPLLDKIFTLSLDQRWRAMFGAREPGITWNEIEKKRQTVLLDFRHVVDTDMRRFQLLWVFSYLYAWIKTRGRSPQPFGVVIDEFVALTQKVEQGENPVAVELSEFIQQYMRQHQIWLTIGLQSPLQLDAQLQQTVLSLGTYLFGQATTFDAAQLLASAMFLRDPYRVKHYRWRSVRVSPREWAVQEEPEFMPLHEQRELFAQRLMKLKQFQFLLRPAKSEGEITTDVFPISIRTVDLDQETGKLHFPHRELLIELRATLAARSGTPVDVLIKEQEARFAPALPPGATGHRRSQRDQRQPDVQTQRGQEHNQHRPAEPTDTEPNQRGGAHPRRHRVRVA
jgi:hypothetical protein